MTNKRSWLLAAISVVTLLAACEFKDYVEFLRVPKEAAQDGTAMTALTDGRVVQLVCPVQANCTLKAFKDGRGIGSLNTGAVYVDVDAADPAPVFWAVKSDSVVDRFGFDANNRIIKTGKVRWTKPSGFHPTALAVGRSNYLYLGGYMLTPDPDDGNASTGVLVRMTLARDTTEGDFTGKNLVLQTVRSDSLDPLSSVTQLDVDLDSGDVYAVNMWGFIVPFGSSLHAYTEALAPIGMAARTYPSLVHDMQAGGSAIAVGYPAEGGTMIEIVTRGNDAFVWQASQLDPVATSPLDPGTTVRFAGYQISSYCAYIWTIGAHSPGSDGKVNLFGRHTLCQ
jgi:hypothetical protein